MSEDVTTVEGGAGTAEVPAGSPAGDAAAGAPLPARPPDRAPSGPGGPGGPTDFLQPGPGPAELQPPGVPTDQSTYLNYLPGLYSDNVFLGRFLLIFEHILSPIERTIANVHHYLDPDLAPPEFVNWLGSWLGLVVDERWPEERRRALVKAAPFLYRWRGTRRGMKEIIRLYSGFEPEIEEPTLSQLASNRALAFRVTVRLQVPDDANIDEAMLRSLVNLEKPAFTACAVEVVREQAS